ncbi:MAG: tetratricopeptide repeat protein [Gemmataceae bacterium]|nr:tetratricopeptide repeat protein [Gemmataceae bacterium]
MAASQPTWRSRKWVTGPLLVGGLLSLGLAAAWWGGWRERLLSSGRSATESAPLEDPRWTFATPYRNAHPEVQYVGDETCARCHPGHAQTYRQHPMGRSLAPVSSAVPVERYDEAAHNPLDALGFRYHIRRRGNQVFHQESVLDARGHVVLALEAEVHYAVGSGRRGRSYLVNRDGRLFESPLTWYPQKALWDLSPSYAQRHRHFSRTISAGCLFCHSNRVLEVEHTLNGFQPPIFQGYAIGCERCHGPGELHVRRQEQAQDYEGPDDTIVNPRRLTPELREAVCQQCHLQGQYRVQRYGRHTFDFRPGLPLRQFWSIFVRPRSSDEAMPFVGQVEQLDGSRCFQASRGSMGCISCHDPHALPSRGQRVAYYRTRCLSCHADQGCRLPASVRRQQQPDESCIACHMPARDTEVLHTAVTDHRILRRPDSGAKTPPPGRRSPGESAVVPFHQDLVRSNDRGVPRDLAVALMDRIDRYPQPIREELGAGVLPWLDAALLDHPDDLEAGHAKALALWALGRLPEAAATFDTVLAQAPRRETTLQGAAAVALQLGRLPAAGSYWQRALEVNPYRSEFHYGLARQLVQARSWSSAVQACQRALQLDLAHVEVRKLLVRCYLELGEKDRARVEFERLLALNPPDSETLRRWFQEQFP